MKVATSLILIFLLMGCQQSPQKVSKIPTEILEENESYLHQDHSPGDLKRLNESIETALELDLDDQQRSRVYLLSNFVSELKQNPANPDLISQYQLLNSHIEINNVRIGYHPDSFEQVSRVKDHYGELFLPKKSKFKTLKASFDAWTSYWYPVSSSNNLLGNGSALDKFDRLLQSNGRASGAVAEEKSIIKGLSVEPWEGHCHAWAMASLVYPEPQKKIWMDNVELSIADQKALLTKASENTKVISYGIKYLGSGKTDGTRQDIRPEAFHRLVTYNLENGIPLAIDDDAGPEVWTRPIMGYSYSIKPDPNIPNAILVKAFMTLVYERHNFSEANDLTDSRHRSNVILEYRLYHESKSDSGKYKIIRGEWINDSFESHPDMVIIPVLSSPGSFNPFIEKNRDLLDRMVQRSIN